MTDDPLKPYLDELKTDYRLPVEEPSFDAMWQRIEREVYDAPVRDWRSLRWTSARRWLPLAAVLFLGIGIGQGLDTYLTPGGSAESTALRGNGLQEIPAVNVSSEAVPFAGLAADYLEQTTGFFLTLATEVRSGQPLEASIPKARDLLGTTRLLLDASETDPGLRVLLEDLELVLAQLVRLPPTDRGGPETHFIAETLDQREVLPRLQVFLADARDFQ